MESEVCPLNIGSVVRSDTALYPVPNVRTILLKGMSVLNMISVFLIGMSKKNSKGRLFSELNISSVVCVLCNLVKTGWCSAVVMRTLWLSVVLQNCFHSPLSVWTVGWPGLAPEFFILIWSARPPLGELRKEKAPVGWAELRLYHFSQYKILLCYESFVSKLEGISLQELVYKKESSLKG